MKKAVGGLLHIKFLKLTKNWRYMFNIFMSIFIHMYIRIYAVEFISSKL